MILGTIPDLILGGAALGIGRAYNKRWLAIIGGLYVAGTVVLTGVQMYLVYQAAKARQAGA